MHLQKKCEKESEKMKKFFSKIKEWFIWLTSKKVGQAINDGASYEEVNKIVEEELVK